MKTEYLGSFNNKGRCLGHSEIEDDYSEESFPGKHKTKWFDESGLWIRKDMDGEVRIIQEGKK